MKKPTLRRRWLWGFAATLVTVTLTMLGLAEAQAQERKPNILIIWGDDIGVHNISAYNHGIMGYRTPNIDRIAREGALFTDAYGEQSCTAGLQCGPPIACASSCIPPSYAAYSRQKTQCRLVTYCTLFFMPLGSRKVHVAGMTPHPGQGWMIQITRLPAYWPIRGSRGGYEPLAFSGDGPLSGSAEHLARCAHQSDEYFPGAIDSPARP